MALCRQAPNHLACGGLQAAVLRVGFARFEKRVFLTLEYLVQKAKRLVVLARGQSLLGARHGAGEQPIRRQIHARVGVVLDPCTSTWILGILSAESPPLCLGKLQANSKAKREKHAADR